MVHNFFSLSKKNREKFTAALVLNDYMWAYEIAMDCYQSLKEIFNDIQDASASDTRIMVKELSMWVEFATLAYNCLKLQTEGK